MTDPSGLSFRMPSGLTVALSPDEYRLALLAQVDFEGQWEGLETATAFVVDGPAKARLIREHLLPIAGLLSMLLNRKVDALELLVVRHWFRNEACQATVLQDFAEEAR